MTDVVELAQHLDQLCVPDEIDRDWFLAEFTTPLGIRTGSALADLCEDMFVVASSEAGSDLRMRPGGWQVNIRGSLVKALLAAVLVGAGLFVDGKDDIPAEIIPAVLPLLVDLTRVRLNRQDRALHVPLSLATAGLEGMSINPQVIYNRLDPAVREQLNYGDFVSYCERLVDAGEMDDGGFDELRIRQPGAPAWLRISWR